MSHGKLDSGEPNLVPLLDLVFQLIMFFMICANFVMEDLNENIKLPQATSAKSLDTGEANFEFVNVNEEGHLIVSDGRPPRTNPAQIQDWFNELYRVEETRLAGKPVDTIIVIRGDGRARFKDIHAVMTAARNARNSAGMPAGFRTIQLRAIIAEN